MYAYWQRSSRGRHARVIHREVELTGVTACGVVIPSHAVRVAKVSKAAPICKSCRSRFKDHRRRKVLITHDAVQVAIAAFAANGGIVKKLPAQVVPPTITVWSRLDYSATLNLTDFEELST